ncbi:MAG: NAD(P)-dependent oxidoreductase [Actinomycetota bacterium]
MQLEPPTAPRIVLVPPAVNRHALGAAPAGFEFVVMPASIDDALPARVTNAEVLVVDWLHRDTVTSLIPRLGELRLVQSINAGVDWLVPLTTHTVLAGARGVHDVSVAEWVSAAVLTMTRDLPRYWDLQREQRLEHHQQQELAGAQVLIVGYGSIGAAVEARLTVFGTRFTRIALRDGFHNLDDLSELVGAADVVVNLLPSTPSTRGCFDDSVFARFRDGALFVNAGRGDAVHTAALLDHLTRGRIRAALDVTDPEPLPATHPLWTAPNVLITPHVAGDTDALLQRAYRFVAEQLDRYAAGRPLHNVVAGEY